MTQHREPSVESIFPLRLTPFEELFYFSNSAACPATSFCLVSLASRLDANIAISAWEQTLQRHPLSQSSVHRDSRNRPWFHTTKHSRPSFFVYEQDWNEASFTNIKIDPDRDALVRLSMFQGHERSQLLFQAHHCVVDAIGAFQIFRDWLTWYFHLASGSNTRPKLPKLDLSDLSQRGQSNLTWRERLGLLSKQWHSLKGVFKFQNRTVIPLVRNDPSGSVPRATEPLSIFSRKLSKQATQNLRRFAHDHQVTVNSLLLADLFVALSQWQSKRNDPPDGTHWRIAVPVNERTIRHRRMSACNHCTMIFMDRSRSEVAEHQSLLSGIQQQMEFILKWKLSQNMWRYLWLLSRLPGGIAKRVAKQSKQTYATVVFSNIGDLNLKRIQRDTTCDLPNVESFEPVGPLQPGTPVTISSLYFAEQLQLTFRYDPQIVSESEIIEFAELFRVQSTRHLAQSL